MDQARPPLRKAKSLMDTPDSSDASKLEIDSELNSEFVEKLIRSQSERLDEQRCSAFLLNQELIKLIDKVQSRGRMEDQRCNKLPEYRNGCQK